MLVLWSGAELENPRQALLPTSVAGPGGTPLTPTRRCGTWTSGPLEPRAQEEPLPREARPPAHCGEATIWFRNTLPPPLRSSPTHFPLRFAN